jgi:YidC/Oxa1 family membrane protein insertase
MMPKPADSAQAKQTSTMNIAMSFMMVFMAWNFNAGLVLYWVTQNVIQMGQNLLIKKVLVKKVD